MRNDSRPNRGEEGSVTILTLTLGFVICCAGVLGLLFVQLTLARATLGSYADLAAIAALQTVGEPCAAAETIAVRNGVELSGCELSFGRVVVEVQMTAPELLSRFSNIDVLAVTARAGY